MKKVNFDVIVVVCLIALVAIAITHIAYTRHKMVSAPMSEEKMVKQIRLTHDQLMVILEATYLEGAICGLQNNCNWKLDSIKLRERTETFVMDWYK